MRWIVAVLGLCAGCQPGTESLGEGSVDAEGVRCDEEPPVFPAFSRACVADRDCAAVLHQTDCCGSQAWRGIAEQAAAEFMAAEALCVEQLPACRCAPEPTIDDDANVVVDDRVEAACVAGECRSAATP